MKRSERKARRPQPLKKLFGKVLPHNYAEKYALIHQYQQFFHEQQNDAVFQLVKVMNVTSNSITVSVPSPALVTYLRLHSQQLDESIQQQFGQHMELIIKAVPESDKPKTVKLEPARHCSEQVSEQVRKSSSSLEHEELKQAMIRLAKAIKD